MRRNVAALAAILVMSIIAIGAVQVCSKGDSHSQPSSINHSQTPSTAMPVEVSIAGELLAPEIVMRFRGVVRARRESSLAFRRSGRVTSIHVHEGDVVQAGNVLGTLDTADLDAKRKQAEAGLASMKAIFDEAIAGPRAQTIDAAKASVRRVEAQWKSAQKHLEREIQLERRGAGSPQALDIAKFDVDRLAAEIVLTGAQLEVLREGTRREQIDAARAAVVSAVAVITQIDVELTDSTIVAPFDAMVTRRMIDEGTIASPNQVALRIIERPPLEARIGLPPSFIDGLKLGQTLSIETSNGNANPAGVLAAKLVRIHPTIDPQTRTRAIDVLLEVSASVVVGQNITVGIRQSQENSPENSFWVPTTSLVRGSRGLWSVMVAVPSEHEPNRNSSTARQAGFIAERRNVRVHQSVGSMTEVVGMLHAEDRVITTGTHRIGPGVAVHPQSRRDFGSSGTVNSSGKVDP